MAIAVPIEPVPGAVWNVVVAVPSATVLGVLTETVWTSALIIAGAANAQDSLDQGKSPALPAGQ